MKNTKKTLSVLLALLLCLTLSIGAFAADTYSITINNETEGHTYVAYQIFSGDLSYSADGDPVLSNIEWGSGVTNTTALLTELAAVNSKFADCSTAADVAGVLGDKGFTTAETTAFAEVVGKYLSAHTDSSYANKAYTITLTAPGYYLVKDKDSSLEAAETYTDYIVQVLGTVTMEPKDGTVTSQKKVQDTNDSVAESTTGWQDSADYDIEDTVPFQISVSLPDNYGSFSEYALTIHDEQSAGLDFITDPVVVTVGGDTLTRDVDYTVKTEGIADDCTFEIVITDLKAAAPAATASDSVVVTYTATLNENAVIGSQGNPNKSYVTFSNNPNGTGTGRTPDDTVIVFTYKVDVTKNDGNGQALAGAEFHLQKYNAATETWGEIDRVTISATDGVNNVFSFTGLDDGIYRLKETVTPNGYNTIDDIQFTVTATHDAENDNPTLTGLSVTDAKYVDRETGADIESGTIDLGPFTCTVDSGSIATTVVNVGGTTLPETGGIGTTIFYVLGGLLVVGAVVVLVVRRRVREN